MKWIFLTLLSCTTAFSADLDSGFRVYTEKNPIGESIRIAAEEGPPTSLLRMGLSEKTVGISLVLPADPYASSVQIMTADGIKALKRYVPTWNPQRCVWRGVESVYGAAAAICPANYGVVVSSNGDSLTYICCELPHDDILVGLVRLAGEWCGFNAIVVGARYSDMHTAELYCRDINSAKYQASLFASQPACVWSEGGTHGWGDAPLCGSFPPVIYAPDPSGVEKGVGTDGCTGQPYGALMTARTDKKCSGGPMGKGQFYVQLRRVDGTLVQMFQP